ncbi:putative ADP-ribosylation factor GTPase-activating protein AGD14 [Apostasia shenzhenica]|uniref:Putative ADP-ribosylation factor GTPase-activating protein AGD14 n=1 Tax=Apostasia shenzhenica TaxID=1088818 RepID=A0A2I0ANW5_9ASPA|nr:putative ADP-ribosylation factor GTPase-activating protein AGD14 [Apostasia shenzhenica]
MKDDEKNEKIIRGLLKLPANRSNRLESLHATSRSCSGLHRSAASACREFTHRVKSISMAKFTSQEVIALQEGGNEHAKEIYFKDWDPQRHSYPDSSNLDRLRDFIKHVYVDRRYSGGKSAEGPPRMKDDYVETRRPDSYRSGSQSPPYNDAYERRFGERPGSTGRNEDRNIRPNYDARRFAYDQTNYTPSGLDKIDETRRDDKGGNVIQLPISDNRIQEGLPKTIVSDHQKGVYISSSPNPVVRPVRDILGGDVPPLQVGEPPRLSGPKAPNSPLDTQASTSSSMESNVVNPAELKGANSGSLIDFSADPEPLVASAAQASSAQPTISIAGNSDGGWASFDVSSQQKALEATSSKGDLESVLSQLSIQVPSSGANPATPPIVNIHSSPKVNNNAQWATENQQLSSLPVGSTQLPIRPVNTPVGSLNMQVNSQPSRPSYGTTTQGPVAILDTLYSHAAMHPSHAVSGNSQNPVEARFPGRKELPVDLFTGLYPMPLAYGGWSMGPRQGMAYGMHYPVMTAIHGAARQPVMAFRGSSMSTNPFDAIPNPTPAHNPMIPSMTSFQGAQPPMNIPPSIPDGSNLGAIPSQWTPSQQFSYQSTASPASYTTQQFPRNMPQQLPSSSFLTMNQGIGVGSETSPYGIPAVTDIQLHQAPISARTTPSLLLLVEILLDRRKKHGHWFISLHLSSRFIGYLFEVASEILSNHWLEQLENW